MGTPPHGLENRDRDFTEFVSARYDHLVRTAVLLGCGHHEAEDVVQATLVKCYVSWQKVARAGNRDAYVYRSLVNSRAQSMRRKWRGERAAPHVEPGQNDAMPAFEVVDSVRRALSGLSREQREVAVLRFYADLSEAQTAQVLGIPVGTVKSRLSRALKRLAEDKHLADERIGWRG